MRSFDFRHCVALSVLKRAQYISSSKADTHRYLVLFLSVDAVDDAEGGVGTEL